MFPRLKEREKQMAGTLSDLRASMGGSGGDFISRLIDTFLASSTELAGVIRASARAEDWDAVARATHQLKSSSAQVGAGRLSSLAKELEAFARAGAGTGAEELLAQLDVELESAHEALVAQQFGASDDD